LRQAEPGAQFIDVLSPFLVKGLEDGDSNGRRQPLQNLIALLDVDREKIGLQRNAQPVVSCVYIRKADTVQRR
jgi:hypothetical protein